MTQPAINDFLLSLAPLRQKEPWEHPRTADDINPMLWDCETSGCFNKMKRPKIELFARCFPGKCQMSDIDAEIEINSHWLRLEWKSNGGRLHRGQELNYTRLTLHCPRHVVLVIYGDAQEMSAIQKVDRYYIGELEVDWMQIRTLDQLRLEITGWAQWADQLL